MKESVLSYWLTATLCFWFFPLFTDGWFVSKTTPVRNVASERRIRHTLIFSSSPSGDSNSGPEEVKDWRDFRAKLVMQSRGVSASSSWAYDSGQVIEQGSLICSKPSQDFGYSGLRQQYFQKTLILVLEHTPSFTKGIILNRPTHFSMDSLFNDDVVLTDRNDGQIWFGGDVQGLESSHWHLECLHTLSTIEAKEMSVPIYNSGQIRRISWPNALELIQSGLASPKDLHIFCGYCGWGPDQLQNELDRDDWYMVATDEKSVLDCLSATITNMKNDIAGIATWNDIMTRIGRQLSDSDFENSMLNEWVTEHLTCIDRVLQIDNDSFDGKSNRRIPAGSVLRASSKESPPFWPDDALWHKSLVLILNDNDQGTMGVVLNRPSSSIVSIQTAADSIDLPLFFGGRFGMVARAKKPVFWLHCNQNAMMEAKVGSPIGYSSIWTCTQEDAETAIDMGLAFPRDFLIVSGLTVWPRVQKHATSMWSLRQELARGRLEVVDDPNNVQDSWNILKHQTVLTAETLDQAIELSSSAWQASLSPEETSVTEMSKNALADVALKKYLETFFLSKK